MRPFLLFYENFCVVFAKFVQIFTTVCCQIDFVFLLPNLEVGEDDMRVRFAKELKIQLQGRKQIGGELSF